MNTEQFCYWLQGYAELNPDNPPTPEQWKMIQEHLRLVFTKVTPPLMPSYPCPDTRPDFHLPEITCSTHVHDNPDIKAYC